MSVCDTARDAPHDVVIVGGGIAGALIAKRLSAKRRRAPILEAGADDGETSETCRAHHTADQRNPVKGPDSPYPQTPPAPSPTVPETGPVAPGPPDQAGYFVQKGPLPFRPDDPMREGPRAEDVAHLPRVHAGMPGFDRLYTDVPLTLRAAVMGAPDRLRERAPTRIALRRAAGVLMRLPVDTTGETRRPGRPDAATAGPIMAGPLRAGFSGFTPIAVPLYRRRFGPTAEGWIMANVVVVGAQWGDEGKGKIVDWLSERADVIARFQGGHNAGHTLMIDGTVYKLNALPSGVVRGGKLSVIGNGVVLDPWHLVDEIAKIQGQGVTITPETLMIAENTPLILPIHGQLDRAREEAASKGTKIGTTGRGIGPAYEDKVGRRAVRVADLADEATLIARVDRALQHHDPLRRGLGIEAVDREALIADLKDIAPQILPYAAPVWKVMGEKRRAGKRILFEGAQGALLDIDFGTYPFVTSSNVIAGQAATGVGIGPGAIDYVLGIVKAYTTRVGEGPFPTELDDADGHRLGERGREFGTVTGRQRRCGWFDACLVRQTCATSGVNGISLTKLDVLDGFETLRICVGYDLDGKRLDYLPIASEQQARCTPVYEDLPGWTESTEGARRWADLPANAIKYVRRVEELIDCPVALLSTSPEREDTILVTDPFAD